MNESRNHDRGRSRKQRKPKFPVYLTVGLIICLVVVSGYFVVNKYGSGFLAAFQTDTDAKADITTAIPEGRRVMVDQIDITGLSKEDAKTAIAKAYPWSLTLTLDDQTYMVPDLLSEKIDDLLEEIYKGGSQEHYTFDVAIEDAIVSEVETIASTWNRSPNNANIVGYDKEKAAFLFGEGEKGIEIDQDGLAAELSRAVSDKTFDAVIAVPFKELAADADASTQNYQVIGTYTTKTTSNKNRNTNINLSAQALNGTIVKPGEELSFNEAVGQRTAKSGYKSAAAYSNGEVVQEIGGGVCQLSTTLYNATVRAGLAPTKRQSHTFEPSYVTPGMDATVSWKEPDYRFKNNSATSIGILANYSNQQVTVSVYGIPILEEGVEHTLKSKKLSNTGAPAPTYVEDPSLQPGVEVVKSGGSGGSRWETRLVITQNGEIVSQEVDHVVTYKGHAPVVARNTTAIPETTAPIDTPLVVESIPSETQPAGTNGPGAGSGDTTASPTETAVPNGSSDGSQSSTPIPVPVGPGAS